MSRTIRSNNLDLIRWMNGGHKPTCKKLAKVTNENYISKMASGEMEISDSVAREIESTLGFFNGWLDRDNEALLNLSSSDYEIINILSKKSNAAKNGLLDFIAK